MSGRTFAGLLAAAVLAVAVAAYLPVRHSGFVQDDHPILELNPFVHDGAVGKILTTDWWAGVGGSDARLYRPVTLLSFLPLRDDEGHVVPSRAHAVNVLLHVLAALALGWLALRVGAGRWAATVAALLFAVHPVHAGAVSGLVGRAEILATLFGLLALAVYAGRGRGASWVAGALTLLALGSKESAIAVPALLLVVDLAVRRPEPVGVVAWARERAAALAPAASAAIAYLALRAHAVGSLLATQAPRLSDNPLVGTAGIERFATALAVAGRYAVLLLFPRTLSADYSGNVVAREPSLLAPLPLLGLAWLLGFVALYVGARRRRRAAVEVGSALFVLPYLVVGNLVVLIGVVMAERLVYLASAGVCLIAGVGLATLVPRLRPAGVAALVSVLVVAGAWRTHVEALAWRNEKALFEAVAAAYPGNPRAQFTLGKIALDEGRVDDALSRFDATLALWPEFSGAWFERGLILAERGDLAEAERSFRQAARINPYHAEARLDLGLVLSRRGRLDEAVRVLRETLERFPGTAKAAAELGHVLARQGRWGEAAEAYAEAVRLGRADLEPALREARARALAAPG